MSARSVLGRGRRRHAGLFLDAVAITRVTGRTLGDDNAYTDTETTIYSGPARLKRSTTAPATPLQGDQAVTVRQYELDLPWDAVAATVGDVSAVVPGDVARLTASDDAWAVGVPLTVLDAGLSGSTTCRRLTVEARS